MIRKNLFKKKQTYTKNKKINILDFESNPLDTENIQVTVHEKIEMKKINPKNKIIICPIITIIIVLLLIIIFILVNLVNHFKEKENSKYDYNLPFLPLNKDEIIVKKYHKTKYDSSKLRFHYEDLYKNRTLFKINYNYLPYTKILKSLTFDENAKNIFDDTGMLNMSLLNIYYFNNVTDRSDFNHIHVCMGMNAKIVFLSLVSMCSLFNNSSPDTFIHMHVLLVNCTFEHIQIIYGLQHINKNVEFIFYNAKQVEYDFPRGKNESKGRGFGDYTRLLAPQIVNNTNRLIILDSGDIFVNKDLSELYYFDIGDNYFVFSLENGAGKNDNYYVFSRNNFYPNTGVCLINVRKFREDNLYQKAFYASIAYSFLPCPYQDILLVISNFKFKYWPLNYNCPQFFGNETELKIRKNDTVYIKTFMGQQKNSPFKYTIDEILDAASDPVINHLYPTKPILGLANNYFKKKFREYADMSGYHKEIKQQFVLSP